MLTLENSNRQCLCENHDRNEWMFKNVSIVNCCIVITIRYFRFKYNCRKTSFKSRKYFKRHRKILMPVAFFYYFYKHTDCKCQLISDNTLSAVELIKMSILSMILNHRFYLRDINPLRSEFRSVEKKSFSFHVIFISNFSK